MGLLFYLYFSLRSRTAVLSEQLADKGSIPYGTIGDYMSIKRHNISLSWSLGITFIHHFCWSIALCKCMHWTGLHACMSLFDFVNYLQDFILPCILVCSLLWFCRSYWSTKNCIGPYNIVFSLFKHQMSWLPSSFICSFVKVDHFGWIQHWSTSYPSFMCHLSSSLVLFFLLAVADGFSWWFLLDRLYFSFSTKFLNLNFVCTVTSCSPWSALWWDVALMFGGGGWTNISFRVLCCLNVSIQQHVVFIARGPYCSDGFYKRCLTLVFIWIFYLFFLQFCFLTYSRGDSFWFCLIMNESSIVCLCVASFHFKWFPCWQLVLFWLLVCLLHCELGRSDFPRSQCYRFSAWKLLITVLYATDSLTLVSIYPYDLFFSPPFFTIPNFVEKSNFSR